MKILSPQERKILELISEGIQNKGIAEKLFLSVHTVKNHKSNMCKKFNLPNTLALYRFALTTNFKKDNEEIQHRL